MDVFAHALWGYVVFGRKRLSKLVVLMSTMPDILSFGIHLVILVLSGGFVFGRPDAHIIPGYVTFMYNTTHSLFIAGLFGLFVYMKFRKYLVLIVAWMMHIVIDIFTHTEDFFPTHFLYPLSDFHLSVVRWSNPWFMLANYFALTVVYSFMIVKHFKRKRISSC